MVATGRHDRTGRDDGERLGLAQREPMLLAGGSEPPVTPLSVAGHIGGQDDPLGLVRSCQAGYLSDRVAVAYQQVATALEQPGPQVGEAVKQETDPVGRR